MKARSGRTLDTQVIGVLGKQRLVEEILRAGLEVAEPVRDRGIDLIAYADLGSNFAAIPIQIKAASLKSFGIHKKYKKFPNLLIAYVWNLSCSDGSVTYCMSYKEAVAIANKMGYTKNPNWKNKDRWDVTSPGEDLCKLIEPYKMNSSKWREKIMKNKYAIVK